MLGAAVPGRELTASAIRYLFAPSWALAAGGGATLKVPGGKVDAPDTAANLLSLAVWNLREQGLVDAQQIRPVEEERVTVMGGKSFVRVTALDPVTPLPGLEGALLGAMREKPEEGLLGRFDDALGKALSRDDPNGLRGHILALNLSSGSPWATVAGFCRQEALDAGLITLEGRLFKKPVVRDEAAIEALRPRNDEIAAARETWRDRESEFAQALIADCLLTVYWAYQTSS